MTALLASVSSTYTDLVTSVFSTTIAAKAWFASAAVAFAVVQVLTGARIYGRIRHLLPLSQRSVGRAHRWSGRIAVLCTLPVAFHCIFILGIQTGDWRVTAHSVLGSFVYGVLVVKLLFVHGRGYPGWLLPVTGGSLFAVLVGLWATSSLWYFTEIRFGF